MGIWYINVLDIMQLNFNQDNKLPFEKYGIFFHFTLKSVGSDVWIAPAPFDNYKHLGDGFTIIVITGTAISLAMIWDKENFTSCQTQCGGANQKKKMMKFFWSLNFRPESEKKPDIL